MFSGLRVNAPYKARLTKQITKKINGMNGWLDGIGYDCNETIELRLWVGYCGGKWISLFGHLKTPLGIPYLNSLAETPPPRTGIGGIVWKVQKPDFLRHGKL